MVIVTALALIVAAYFIYKEFKNTKLIKELKEKIEELVEKQ